MKTNLPYSVPEGYFENLKTRLSAIPGSQAGAPEKGRASRRLWQGMIAVPAMAACLAAGVFIGKTIFGEKVDELALSENDIIIEYLVESGTTLAQIENCFEY